MHDLKMSEERESNKKPVFVFRWDVDCMVRLGFKDFVKCEQKKMFSNHKTICAVPLPRSQFFFSCLMVFIRLSIKIDSAASSGSHAYLN